MKKLALLIIICLLLTPSVFSDDDKLYTLIPPIPVNSPEFASSLRKPYVGAYAHPVLTLEIDKKGKVKSVKPVEPADSLFSDFVSDYLKLIQFEPALKEGKKTKCKLPLIVHLSGKIAVPDFEYPLTTARSSSFLLNLFFKLNEVQLPEILMFPPYNAELKSTDSSLYTYQLYKLNLDKNGKLESRERVLSTNPNFDGQIESAMLYASFSPFKVKNTGKRTSCLMKISYFPVIQYPTAPYDSQAVNSNSQLIRRRLEILPESAKLLSEPLPKSIPDHLFPISNIKAAFREAVEAYVHIDTLGTVFLMRTDASIKSEIASVRRICSKLRFYPALDMSGKRVEYFGYLRFERFEKTNIRISYLWLK